MSAIAFARLPELFAPLALLLAAGGDTRLRLDPETRLNAYGCRPYPRPEAFTFASSTATSISGRAFTAAERVREDLVRAALRHGLEPAFDAACAALREDLARLLGLDRTGAEIVLSPSGTDAALSALVVARALDGAPLTSVVAAADETGSGVALASAGRHFSTATAQGVAVEKGRPIAGLADGVAYAPVPLRGAGGVASIAAADEAVMRAVAEAAASGGRVLLHVMDHSKLGARSPSADGLAAIERRFGAAVQVVIDACQVRLSRARIAAHLARGHLVLITGSKFFTGPPFSGALLVPAPLSARLAAAPAPGGLADYSSRSDWPVAWPGIRAGLAERANLGQLLRWAAALREMRDYFAVPFAYRRAALARFAERVPGLLAGAGFAALADATSPDPADEEMAVRTIFPFRLGRGERSLALEECTIVYRALNRDVAPLLAALAPGEERLARQLCHIGQPVALADGGAALRISAGARVVSETWSPRDEAASEAALEHEFEQVRTILAKIALLLPALDRLTPAFQATEDGRQTTDSVSVVRPLSSVV